MNLTGVDPYSAEMLNLCESLEAGQPPLVGLDNARRNMRVIDGVTEAARSEKQLEIIEI